MNQDKARSDDLDVFQNGMLIPVSGTVKLIEDDVEYVTNARIDNEYVGRGHDAPGVDAGGEFTRVRFDRYVSLHILSPKSLAFIFSKICCSLSFFLSIFV